MVTSLGRILVFFGCALVDEKNKPHLTTFFFKGCTAVFLVCLFVFCLSWAKWCGGQQTQIMINTWCAYGNRDTAVLSGLLFLDGDILKREDRGKQLRTQIMPFHIVSFYVALSKVPTPSSPRANGLTPSNTGTTVRLNKREEKKRKEKKKYQEPSQPTRPRHH